MSRSRSPARRPAAQTHTPPSPPYASRPGSARPQPLAFLLATRPWSFTASLLPILLTAVFVHCFRVEGVGAPAAAVSWAPLAACVGLALSGQAAANLLNTYVDWESGADTVSHADDRTLVDAVLLPSQVLAAAVALAVVSGCLAVCLAWQAGAALAWVVAAGAALGAGYSIAPVGFKRRGLGDVVVLTVFGPLMTAGTQLVLAGTVTAAAALFTLPCALLTTAILHANNARDVDADAAVGNVTLANRLGPGASLALFVALMLTPFPLAAVALRAVAAHPAAAFAPALVLPLALDAVRDFRNKRLAYV